MEHRPYPKIASRADGSRPAPGGTWVATEKVHGAQLVVASDGRTECFGKRKAWLAHDEPFFGWQLLRSDLGTAARAIHQELSLTGVVRLYGEIFGGKYPHAEVAPLAGVTPVQTGIWYAPDVRFALFDIAVERDGSEPELLSHTEVESLAAANGLFVVPLLGRGPRAQLESLPVRFPSRVPQLLGLPYLADNVAEGFVLKPDARASAASRYVTKWKIPEFDDARFDESEPWNSDVVLDLEALILLARRLVNPARVASARSKVGTRRSDVCEEVVLDVLVDLEAAYPVATRSLDGRDEERLRDCIVALAQELTDTETNPGRATS
jgi:Rnl2 family RNA ligase